MRAWITRDRSGVYLHFSEPKFSSYHKTFWSYMPTKWISDADLASLDVSVAPDQSVEVLLMANVVEAQTPAEAR